MRPLVDSLRTIRSPHAAQPPCTTALGSEAPACSSRGRRHQRQVATLSGVSPARLQHRNQASPGSFWPHITSQASLQPSHLPRWHPAPSPTGRLQRGNKSSPGSLQLLVSALGVAAQAPRGPRQQAGRAVGGQHFWRRAAPEACGRPAQQPCLPDWLRPLLPAPLAWGCARGLRSICAAQLTEQWALLTACASGCSRWHSCCMRRCWTSAASGLHSLNRRAWGAAAAACVRPQVKGRRSYGLREGDAVA